MALDYTLQGQEELERNLAKLGDRLGDGLESAVKAGAYLVRNDASTKAPYKTGNLKKSLHIETTEKSSERIVIQVGTNLIYARIQEFGGVIQAKNVPYLKFKTKDGQWHSVTSVQIPPHPYLRPALDENKDKVPNEIKKSLADIVRRAG